MVKVKSYANIAIVNYWGKKDAAKMIPSTSSISLTLNDMFTETELEFINDEDIKIAVEKEIKSKNCKDKFCFNYFRISFFHNNYKIIN